ncbi:hypothetical protein [Azospirillum sp.]|uniref:hypothetical protein n=1 Tax=Azospirillum sp. TaxID=34012 RepID=UPI002D503497|nr:hypothetical protein [Azospirillum sp.]HYD69550.1 hypothetical protein [Azospirillum sp.]
MIRLPPPPFWRSVYFDQEVTSRPDRQRFTPDEILAVIASPTKMLRQADGRMRYWGYVPRLNRWLRVVVLEDGETVHNAFLDRTFKP